MKVTKTVSELNNMTEYEYQKFCKEMCQTNSVLIITPHVGYVVFETKLNIDLK